MVAITLEKSKVYSMLDNESELFELRNYIKYIEETSWMFETEQLIPMDNLANL